MNPGHNPNIAQRGIQTSRTASVVWMRDPDTAINHPCEVCKAGPGQECRNTIRPGGPLPGRMFHFARCEVTYDP